MLDAIQLSKVTTGYSLPELSVGPINRATLALFAGASNDHVPIHIDSDFAQASGIPDVFCHGMLSMAYLAQLLTRWVPQNRLLHWNVRFVAITPLHSIVRCTGRVVEIFEDDDRRCARVELQAEIQTGAKTIAGEAIIKLN